MPQWIVLSGAHSVGKTTLMNSVCDRRVGVQKMSEVARRVIADRNYSQEDIMPWKSPDTFYECNVEIVVKQVEEFRKLDPRHPAIIDRGLDALGYVKNYQGEEQFQRMIRGPSAINLVNRVRKDCVVFLVTPHRACLEADGLRITSDLEDVQSLHRGITEVYEYFNIPTTTIDVLDLAERVEIIENCLDA